MGNMYDSWSPLQAVLNTGPHYVLDNQAIWQGPIDEFGIPCRIAAPLRAEFDIFPQEDGLLVRGSVTGQVAMPCNRCAEEAVYDLAQRFDNFEPLPSLDENGEPATDPDVDEYFIRFSRNGELEVNLAALAWEEFAQALPPRPLCREECAGLCPSCGTNLNEGACACEKKIHDPRLAKLRGLKIH
ncbi:MAG: DUF177 domain-containing protein [Deltaproteobacteria bacterium]|jgi:uncharacterized protein|nr:DUF177 domain-containing protein [Deltaproteobacteria bacterium]